MKMRALVGSPQHSQSPVQIVELKNFQHIIANGRPLPCSQKTCHDVHVLLEMFQGPVAIEVFQFPLPNEQTLGALDVLIQLCEDVSSQFLPK